jgi:hypothetical protein
MKSLGFLRQSITDKMRGKCVFIGIPQHLKGEELDLFVTRKYDDYIKSSGWINNANYRYPLLAHRLLERVPPYYRRRIIKKIKLRKMDRSIINAYCNSFIWIYRLYKPGKK